MEYMSYHIDDTCSQPFTRLSCQVDFGRVYADFKEDFKPKHDLFLNPTKKCLYPKLSRP